MSTAVTPKSFLSLLGQSGLVDPEVLRSSLAELSHRSAGKPISLDQLCAHLEQQGLITPWHSSKLRGGKYKGFFLGKYKLLGILGSGGMSTVYLAQHTIFQQRRAIKVLPKNRLASKSSLERFYQEGRAAASLNHRNIVRVYDIAQEGDVHYLVMEYVEGQDLYARVRQQGPLSPVQAIDHTIQVLTGLDHAHENDLVHRDVKPANMLLTPDGTVKVLDLGLALFREEESSLTVVHNEKVLGTADYLSPEQAVDSHKVDRRADIYSTGCSLYFMLTGRPPFPEGTLAQRIARHQSVAPDSLRSLRPELPDRLVAIVEKMMEKKAENRYQKCGPVISELRELLETLSSGEKSADPPAGAHSTTARPSRPAMPAASPPVPAARKSAEGAKVAPVPAAGAANPDLKTGMPSPHKPVSPERKATSPQPAARQPDSATKARSQPDPAARPESASPVPNRPAAPAKVTAVPVAAPDSKTAISPSAKGFPVVQIVTDAEAKSKKPEIDATEKELQRFVVEKRKTLPATARLARPSIRSTLVLVCFVAGMLILLGLTVWIAIRVSS